MGLLPVTLLSFPSPVVSDVGCNVPRGAGKGYAKRDEVVAKYMPGYQGATFSLDPSPSCRSPDRCLRCFAVMEEGWLNVQVRLQCHAPGNLSLFY
jgi:hypothetical protein